jgi:hypothetical protein
MKLKFPRLRAFRVIGLIALFGWTTFVSAISVTPPTFTDLMDRAEVIVEATVADIQTQWVANAKGYRVIKTFVRLTVAETVKGAPEPEINLSFFGGKLDGQTMAIAGMPTFRKGQRGWFFIKDNHRVICPLIYAHHGAYLVSSPRDQTPAQVTRLNGSVLHSVEEIGTEAHGSDALSSAPPTLSLTAADFRVAIKSEYRRLRANQFTQP